MATPGAIDIAAIKTAYDALGLIVPVTIAAKADIDALGARPIFPDVITSSASYNDVLDDQIAWDAAMVIAVAAYNTAIENQKTAELACLIEMFPSFDADAVDAGNFSIGPAFLKAPKEWFRLTLLANWGGSATQWIGIKEASSTNATTTVMPGLIWIFAVNALPTQEFPNI